MKVRAKEQNIRIYGEHNHTRVRPGINLLEHIDLYFIMLKRVPETNNALHAV